MLLEEDEELWSKTSNKIETYVTELLHVFFKTFSLQKSFDCFHEEAWS